MADDPVDPEVERTIREIAFWVLSEALEAIDTDERTYRNKQEGRPMS